MKFSIPGLTCILALSFMICCKKSNDNAGPSKTIQVTEYNSGRPLEQAVVYFYKWAFNSISGGYIYFLIDSLKTDQTGSVSISESIYQQTASISISKGNYWSFNYEENPMHSTSFELDIIAHLKLHLVDTSVIPVNTSIQLSAKSERFGSISNHSFNTGNLLIFPIPADTTLTFDVFGGQKNMILMTFYQLDGLPSPLSGSYPVVVSRDGITEFEIKY